MSIRIDLDLNRGYVTVTIRKYESNFSCFNGASLLNSAAEPEISTAVQVYKLVFHSINLLEASCRLSDCVSLSIAFIPVQYKLNVASGPQWREELP